MNLNEFENPKKSNVLFEFSDKLDFFINLYNQKKFPKILMLTGKKGIGKFTLINHFLNFVFDKNYDQKNKTINTDSAMYKQYLNNIFPNIVYLQGSHHQNIKIEDIRSLKTKIVKSTLLKDKRFIVLDDIDLFNSNSVNALLKSLEEPNLNDYFILINNMSKEIIETIHSRSIEFKIFLTNEKKLNIINSLIEKNNLEVLIETEHSYLTPGNFVLLNNKKTFFKWIFLYSLYKI